MIAAGSPHATTLLRQDHRRLKDLFEVFEESDDLLEQKDNVEWIVREWNIHARMEQTLLYPALEHQAAIHSLIDQIQEEHLDIQEAIHDLQDVEAEDPLFFDKWSELEDKIRHHIQLSESDVLPQADESDVDLVHLGNLMTDLRKSLMGEAMEAERIGMSRRGKGPRRKV